MAITATQMADGTFQFAGRAHQITKAKNEALAPFGCMVHNYGVVFRILPDDKQRTVLNQQIGNARFVRNRYLHDRIEHYAETKQTLSVSDYKKNQLPALKKEFSFLYASDKFALEAALEHVESAYQNFFSRRARFPKFASKWKPNGNTYSTKYTNNNIELIADGGKCYIKLPKIGKIRLVLPRNRYIGDIVPNGTSILGATVKKQGDSYTVSLKLETVIKKPEPTNTVFIKEIMAADMGLKLFAVLCSIDHTEEIENPRWIRKHAKRLRRFQKALSRKQYDKKTHTGSKNWEKEKAKVAREQRKCANQRKDFQHKLSLKIADSCTVFVCEDLNISGMVKNCHLSKEISCRETLYLMP